MAVETPKKILFIITQSELGGAMRFVSELVTRLPLDKYQPLVVTGQDGDRTLLNALHAHNIATGVLTSLRRKPSWWQDLKVVWELRQLIKSFQPQTLFLNSSKAGFIGALAANFPYRLKTQVIYRIGGWTFNDPWPAWKKRLWLWLEKISARWKDIIIVNNEHDFKQAAVLKIRPRNKVVLIHNGIDTKAIRFLGRDEARLKLFEPIARSAGKVFQAKLVIGTIANYYPSKGLPYLLEAIAQLTDHPEVAWIIIGRPSPEIATPRLRRSSHVSIFSSIQKIITDNKLDKQVFLIDALPEARRLLSAFDAFVLPSLKEGLPWAILEAMAAKLAIVSTTVGGIPELIDSGKNGLLVPPADATALAQALRQIISNPALRTELGAQAQQTVLADFSMEKMVKTVVDLL